MSTSSKLLHTLVALALTLCAAPISAQVVGVAGPSCNGSGSVLAAFDDGQAFLGTRFICVGCPLTDTLNWSPAPCGNILGGAGHAGDRLVCVTAINGLCGAIIALTAQGYLLAGSPEQCWSALLDDQTIFQKAGRPAGTVLGAGTQSGGELWAVTALGEVLRVSFSGVQFQTVTRMGTVPGLLPTPALHRSWAEVKLHYR